MPEIKHNFTGGKMNKDLDERLIPNGQYRDAVNIQVSTSEGSDVGSAQNILGNSMVPGQGFISSDAVCVGSVSDEKNDKLYWFVINYGGEELVTNGDFDGNADGWTAGGITIGASTAGSPLPANGWSYGTNDITATDVLKFEGLVQAGVAIKTGKTYVIKCEISNWSGTGDLTPVIVDQSGYWTRAGNHYNDYINQAATDAGTYTWTLRASVKHIEGQETPYTPAGWAPYLPNLLYFQNRADTSGGANKLNCTIDKVSVRTVNSSCIVQYDTKLNKVVPVFVDVDNSVLKLNPSNLITGVNIIDDLLLWTDNNSEPKKINIKHSIEGTNSWGHTNTYLINPAQQIGIGDQVSVEEEHITVVRRPPKYPPTIQYTTFRDVNKEYTGIIKISDNFDHPNSFLESSIGKVHDFSFLDVGDTFRTIIETDIKNSNEFTLDWKVGDKVVLKEFDYNGESPAIPIGNYRIKGTITDWGGNSFSNTNFLLTENGDLSEGSSGIPDHWGVHSNWTWDQTHNVLTCNGSSASIHAKIYNDNSNRDIVEGGRYKIKYSIYDPPGGSMSGKVKVVLTGSDIISSGANAGDGYYETIGSHMSPGDYEHELVWSNDHEWLWGSGSGAYLNTIMFESKSDGTTGLGPQILDISNYSTVTSGTLVGVGPAHSITSGVITWNTWEMINNRQVRFHTQFISPTQTNINTNVYMSNVMTEDLITGEDYKIILTVSDMSFIGGGHSQLGVSSVGGVGNDVRFETSGSNAPSQATSSDPWSGLGGRIEHTFTATGTGKIDLLAKRNEGLDYQHGPTGEMTISLRKVEESGFHGSIGNISVEELDETQARVEVKIDSIDGIPPDTEENEISLNYAIDKLEEGERLFEFKFPRFGYRYKYKDGEYSIMSPFSEIAFKPGAFNYHPKKGFNSGMTNNITSLEIKDYCRELPSDVSGIELLYKEEHSPSIYIVDEVKDIYSPSSSYSITNETIKSGVISSNQLLRAWDNVPRKALAQEVSGNRLIYGNYLQNYNLIDSSNNQKYNIRIGLENTSTSNLSRSGKKSIKSLREYQVGVVFSDEYGRETPVLTSNEAAISVDKSNSAEINQFTVNIRNEGHPVNMRYFKFFVKDIGGEYYNLAMDRFYDAEDDNIWLAFPSTDRNKVDIDDFLILKKGAGKVIKNTKTGKLNNVIQEKAQYKILDIKNEAPDFIKRKETRILYKRHTSTNTLFHSGDLPVENDANFKIAYNKVENSSIAMLHESLGKVQGEEYYITLSNTDTNRVSDRYKVVQLHADTTSGGWWYFTLEKPFSSEISDFSNDNTGTNTTAILDNTYLSMYKTSIDKSDTSKFDGRFFVKIYDDDIFARALKEGIDENDKVEHKAIGISRKIYSLTTHNNSTRIEKHGPVTVGNASGFFKPGSATGGQTSSGWEVFKNIRSNTTSVGLSTKVVKGDRSTTYQGETLFSWKNYNNITGDFGANLGTLNRRSRKSGKMNFNNDERDRWVWRDYDAYFRGINVHVGSTSLSERLSSIDVHEDNSSDQKFQDVWFIDKARCAGNFRNSTLTDKAVGWKVAPQRSSYNAMGLRSWGSGENGVTDIELAFGGVQPVEWSSKDSGWDNDESFYDLAGENYNYSETEADFIKQIAIGSQFRFKEDPFHTVYTITDVNTYLRVRYETLNYYSTTSEFFDDTPPSWNPSGRLTAHDLFPFHQKALKGKAMGMAEKDSTTGHSNVSGAVTFESKVLGGLETKVEGLEDSITWKTNTYLRPSNYTKNWRIRVDKAFNDHWNPVEDTNGPISNRLNSTKITATGSGHNYIETASIINSQSPEIRLAVGWVLKKYDDSSGGDTDVMSPPCIVSKIEEISSTNYKVWLKTYDGSNDFPIAGEGRPADIGSGDTLYFNQYPMNGLSPNSAKNLNFFRDGKGFGAGKAGTDAIGYTWEWLEEKSARSEEEVLPANPAIWETKPKETKDIDIYYEATGNIPIVSELTSDNMLEIIPIGSTIEYEGSNAIPNNTLVYDVDPYLEQIILSRNIQVEEMTSSERYIAWLQSFGYVPGTVPFVATGGGKIICTELYEQGYLSKEVLDLDFQHSDNNMDILTKIGYWKWATPIVNKMRKSKLFTQIIKPFGIAWAYEMAHREEPLKYNGNILGKFLMFVGVPLCRYIGNKEINKNKIQI